MILLCDRATHKEESEIFNQNKTVKCVNNNEKKQPTNDLELNMNVLTNNSLFSVKY